MLTKNYRMNRNFTKRKNLLKPKNKVAKLPKEETLRTIIDYSKSTKYKSQFFKQLDY